MFHDMPEMTPGAQITKKTHMKIHAIQPGFRKRATDRLNSTVSFITVT